MTPGAQAKIYRDAARIVGGMDTRTQWSLPPGITSGTVGRSYSQQESAIWDAFGSAARVLYTIAAELDKAQEASAQSSTHRGDGE
jgi:hypothetical protein